MFRLFSPWVLGTCLISLNLIFVILAAVLGWLPGILGFLQRAFRGSLVWSYHLFRYLLTRLDPFFEGFVGIRLTLGTPRILACIALSLVCLSLLLALTSLDFSWWLLALGTLHGLAVGYLWGDVLEPGGLHLGSRLQ